MKTLMLLIKLEAFRPQADADKAKRAIAIQSATRFAIETPFKVMETAYNSMKVMHAMADFGNPNSVTDAVWVHCVLVQLLGNFLNVKINCGDCEDSDFVNQILRKGQKLVDDACKMEAKILTLTNTKI